MAKIEEVYFVKKGQSIAGANIKNYIVPAVMPPFVKSGDTFNIDHHMIKTDSGKKYDPWPKEQKDLIIIIKENDTRSELRFSERSNIDKKIAVRIP